MRPARAARRASLWFEGNGSYNDPRWLYADRQGSIIGTAPSSGVMTPYTYGPYGEPQSWAGSRFRYTGQIALPEAQLYHYKARVYDPTQGRFLQTDPIGYGDGMNVYAYTRGDPVNGSDPSGTEAEWAARSAVFGGPFPFDHVGLFVTTSSGQAFQFSYGPSFPYGGGYLEPGGRDSVVFQNDIAAHNSQGVSWNLAQRGTLNLSDESVIVGGTFVNAFLKANPTYYQALPTATGLMQIPNANSNSAAYAAIQIAALVDGKPVPAGFVPWASTPGDSRAGVITNGVQVVFNGSMVVRGTPSQVVFLSNGTSASAVVVSQVHQELRAGSHIYQSVTTTTAMPFDCPTPGPRGCPKHN